MCSSDLRGISSIFIDVIAQYAVIAAGTWGENEISAQGIEKSAQNRIGFAVVTATCNCAGIANRVERLQIVFVLSIGASGGRIGCVGITRHLNKMEPIVFIGINHALSHNGCFVYGQLV